LFDIIFDIINYQWGGIYMPRVARIERKSKIYHIMIRGITHQNIFSLDEVYEKFIAILSKCHKKVNMKSMSIA